MLRAYSFSVVLILVLPFLSVLLSENDLSCLLAFPPEELCRSAEPTIAVLLFAATVASALAIAWGLSRFRPLPLRDRSKRPTASTAAQLSCVLYLSAVAACWYLAWTRHAFAAPLQEHSFFFLWLSFIALCNALETYSSGSCLAIRSPLRFLALFPLSAVFWWLFEYLNRYAQNWEYLLPRSYSASEYLLLASLSFSTVLPAVASLSELLQHHLPSPNRWSLFPRMPWLRSRRVARSALLLSLLQLLLLPLFPQFLYPVLWLAPLLLLFSSMQLLASTTVFPEMIEGDVERAARWMLATLCCGFLWELWNYHSLAKWQYHIPFLGGMKLFEMPLPGYLGYIPFGIICAQGCAIVLPELHRSTLSSSRSAPAAFRL